MVAQNSVMCTFSRKVSTGFLKHQGKDCLPSSIFNLAIRYLRYKPLDKDYKEVINLPKCILTEQQGSGRGGSGSVVLQNIAIKTAPTKTSYLSGDTFDASGMVVEAT